MDPSAPPPRRVIDPSLPPEIARRLRRSPEALRLARLGLVPRTPKNHALIFLLPGFLTLIWMVTNTLGMVVAMFAMGLIALMKWMAVDNTNSVERRYVRLAHEYSHRYVLPEDLDYPCQVLLGRAQHAAVTILASEVHRAGLIDTIDNRVTLPEEMWQLAQRLAKLSKMHAEHRRIVPRNMPQGLAEAFEPYTTALDTAWTSLSQRVRHLEHYATQVLRADEIFRAHRRLEMLIRRTPDYQRLIADTVRDDLARDQIARLSDQARQVHELFQESIAQARLAGVHLVRTPLT